jgi:hypothetical protein
VLVHSWDRWRWLSWMWRRHLGSRLGCQVPPARLQWVYASFRSMGTILLRAAVAPTLSPCMKCASESPQ